MTARDQLQVRVTDELMLDAGTCEEVSGPHGGERLIHPPERSFSTRCSPTCGRSPIRPSALPARWWAARAWPLPHWSYGGARTSPSFSTTASPSSRRSCPTSASGPPRRTAHPSRGIRCHPFGNGSSPRHHTAFSARRDRSPDLPPPLAPGSAEVCPAAVPGAQVPP